MEKEEAAWFLKNRMYMDDTTGRAHDGDNAMRISQDMTDSRKQS
jgi:hypothetical protein